MRRKRPVYANTLGESRAFHAYAFGGDRDEPYRYQLTFEKAHGLAAVAGREAIVTMTGPELASAIGAIPVVSIEDPEDMKALARTMDLLRRAKPRD